eukprot:CAMPEP_0196774990 /NCGR_PEP_ID=MMETSP1104-20130614/3760_1 /TAXON_ID=33652 /ORGANISM="Cafeteria sp., Strain Caron Lab Isolate" /LENGTH=88 /DNA_ID=CAMNT_0042145153 /DNA_START=6 /DNA_END=272 /DNA_ORIENTATION=-
MGPPRRAADARTTVMFLLLVACPVAFVGGIVVRSSRDARTEAEMHDELVINAFLQGTQHQLAESRPQLKDLIQRVEKRLEEADKESSV